MQTNTLALLTKVLCIYSKHIELFISIRNQLIHEGQFLCDFVQSSTPAKTATPE
jgi:hypothetical protein